MRILSRIIELQKSSDISLEYNSNMVAIPPQLLNQWKQFKMVNIGASIDAIGPLATYVRHPSKWEAVEKNCDSIGYRQLPNVNIGLAATISILNIRHLPDLTKWLLSKKYTSFKRYPTWHLLHGPEYLNIQALPDDTKKLIEQEFEDFYQWVSDNISPVDGQTVRNDYSMNQTSRINELAKLKVSLKTVDAIRKESIETIIPWLHELLKNY